MHSRNTEKTKSQDSLLLLVLGSHYIEFLNDYIKSSVQSEARENVSYLEKQLVAISDPLLREKIQSLIANEIEKEMVVSKEAFKVIDPVYLFKSFKEKLLYPIVLGIGSFFLIMMIVIVSNAFLSADKTEDDRILLAKIKTQIFPGKK